MEDDAPRSRMTEHVTVTMTPELLAEMRVAARKRGMTVASLGRHFIQAELRRPAAPPQPPVFASGDGGLIDGWLAGADDAGLTVEQSADATTSWRQRAGLK